MATKTEPTPEGIRDRIVEFRRVPAREVLPATENPRGHPERQRSALQAILERIGFAGALLVRTDEEGRLHLVDGHLRREELGDQEVPVLVTDLSAEEALDLLAVYDPIAALAETIRSKAEALRSRVDGDERLAGVRDKLDEDLRKLRDKAAAGRRPPAQERQETRKKIAQEAGRFSGEVEVLGEGPLAGLGDVVTQGLETVAGYRTAQKRAKPSAPVAWYEEVGLLEEAWSVLEYGCGLDVHDFARYDPAHYPDLEALGRRYDVVLCHYVLNVLPLEHLRAEVLLAIRSLLHPDGFALVAVWRKGERASISKAGYQCEWTAEQWEGLLGRFFEVERLDGAPFLGWKLVRPEGAELGL